MDDFKSDECKEREIENHGVRIVDNDQIEEEYGRDKVLSITDQTTAILYEPLYHDGVELNRLVSTVRALAVLRMAGRMNGVDTVNMERCVYLYV